MQISLRVFLLYSADSMNHSVLEGRTTNGTMVYEDRDGEGSAEGGVAAAESFRPLNNVRRPRGRPRTITAVGSTRLASGRPHNQGRGRPRRVAQSSEPRVVQRRRGRPRRRLSAEDSIDEHRNEIHEIVSFAARNPEEHIPRLPGKL